jgi:Ribonuclease G/E
MKGRTIVLDHIDGQEAAAYLVDGRLDDLLIDITDAPRPGAIFRAICDRPMKGQGGMMLRLPDGDTAFLRQGKGLRPGQPLLVQVTGYAEGGKAIPVTDRILFKSRYAIVTPDRPGLNISRQITDEAERDRLHGIAHATHEGEDGLILRSGCVGMAEEEIAEDIAAMLDLCTAVTGDAAGTEPEALTEGDGPHVLAWRDWTGAAEVVTEAGGFARLGVLDQIDALAFPEVEIGEGHMFVEPTRALVAVDVNTGNDASLAAGIKANMACAKALPRALRLRGLAGQITLDLAPMPKKDRRSFESALRTAFRSDQVETTLVGWTPLGHYELQRKRVRAPLSEVMT